jgi:transposase
MKPVMCSAPDLRAPRGSRWTIEALDLGRPGYHPCVHLKLYIYGYLNRVQSSRRLERECQRNLEVMWLTGRLAPDHETIADFRKDNGRAIKKVCAQFVELCRRMGLIEKASVAIDGSKFKAVNNRDRNFTQAKVEKRRTQLEESVARYLSQLDTADRQDPSEAIELKKTHLKGKLEKLKLEMQKLEAIEKQVLASPDNVLTDDTGVHVEPSTRGKWHDHGDRARWISRWTCRRPMCATPTCSATTRERGCCERPIKASRRGGSRSQRDSVNRSSEDDADLTRLNTSAIRHRAAVFPAIHKLCTIRTSGQFSSD